MTNDFAQELDAQYMHDLTPAPAVENSIELIEDEFEHLVGCFIHARDHAAALHTIYDTPVCGVPGFGHKAAKRARKAIELADARVSDARAALKAWARGNSKMNYKRRQARLARVQTIDPTITLD